MIESKIEKYFSANITQHREMCVFVWTLVNNESIILNENTFYPNNSDEDKYKYTIDKEVANLAVIAPIQPIIFNVSWIIEEIYQKKEIIIKLPILEQWRDVTRMFREYLIKLTKAWILSDFQYTLYWIFAKTWQVFLHEWKYWFKFEYDKEKRMFDKEKKVSFVIVKEVDLEDLLLSEIEQWYINKDIWDPLRWFWYTHLLRQHANFKAFNWFKRVLVNWKKINVVISSRWVWKCQHKLSRIIMSDWTRKYAKDLNIWDSIMWSDYKNQLITNIQYYKKKTIRVTLDNWMSKIISFDHRLPTSKNFLNWKWDNNDNNYKRAYELSLWDKIPVAYDYDIWRNDFDLEDVLLYGYFLWDWTVWMNSIHWNHDRLLNIITKYDITRYDEWNHNRYNIKHFKQWNNFEWYNLKAKEKFIDNRFFSQSNSIKYKLIEWLFNTDWYLGINHINLEYCSVSEQLIDDILELIYSLWIVAYKTKKKIISNFNSDNEFAYYLNISNREDLRKLLDNIDLSSKKNYNEFVKLINIKKTINNNIWTIPLEAFKERTVKWIWHQTLYWWVRKPKYDFQRWKLKNYWIENWGKYSWHKIKSIEELEEDDVVVWITVNNDDSLYFANWILSHNTYNSAYLTIRALLNPKPWFGWRPYREIKYFTPDKSNIWETYFKYCKALIWNLSNKKKDWVPVFKINESKYTIECTLTWNVLQVISLYWLWWNDKWELWKSTWEWLSCDDAIIDEATRIPNIFRDSFNQRAAFETESIFIVSTANEETPADHWAYSLLLQWELWDENINSYRITIDDNELLWIWRSEEERQKIVWKIKDDIRKRSQEELYARAYCIVFNRKKVFNIWWNVLNLKDWSIWDFRVITLDPAKLDDNAWITVININTQFIEKAIKLENADYTYQLKLIKDLKTEYKNSITICDRNWIWELVSELDKDWVIDIRIKTTWVWDLNFNRKQWYYILSKWLVIWILETMFRERILHINIELQNLIDQLNNFERLESKSWKGSVILYKWKWKTKDDLVLSLWYWAVYIYSIMWLKTIEDMKNYWQEFDNSEVYAYTSKEELSYNPYY